MSNRIIAFDPAIEHKYMTATTYNKTVKTETVGKEGEKKEASEVAFDKIQFTTSESYDGLWRIDNLFDDV